MTKSGRRFPCRAPRSRLRFPQHLTAILFWVMSFVACQVRPEPQASGKSSINLSLVSSSDLIPSRNSSACSVVSEMITMNFFRAPAIHQSGKISLLRVDLALPRGAANASYPPFPNDAEVIIFCW